VVELLSRSLLMRRERTYWAPEPCPKYRRMEEDEVGEDDSLHEGGVSALQNSASLGARSMMLDHDVREDSGFSNRACVFAKSREGLRIYVPVLHGMWKPGVELSDGGVIIKMRSRRSYSEDRRETECPSRHGIDSQGIPCNCLSRMRIVCGLGSFCSLADASWYDWSASCVSKTSLIVSAWSVEGSRW